MVIWLSGYFRLLPATARFYRVVYTSNVGIRSSNIRNALLYRRDKLRLYGALVTRIGVR